MRQVKDEESAIITSMQNNAEGGHILSMSEILNLDARDRYEVLNETNKNKYDNAQQQVIENTRQYLL